MDVGFDRPPPHDLNVEASVLASCLLDHQALGVVSGMLAPSDFYRDAHQKIYAAMLDLDGRREPVDVVTVLDALKAAGSLDAVGGPSALAGLIQTVPMSVNVEAHVRLLLGKSMRRQLIRAASEAYQAAFKENGRSTSDVLADAQKALLSIGANLGGGPVPIQDIIVPRLDVYQARQRNRGDVVGVPTGFPDLDRCTLGFQSPDLIILAARPGMGKTALACNISDNAASKDFKVLVFSMEMSREQLFDRMIAARCRMNSRRLLSGYMTADQAKAVHRAANEIHGLPIVIDDSPALAIQQIRARAIREHGKGRIGLVIVDYLQLARSPGTRKREEEVREIASGLKALAKELKIPVLALCQLNRKIEERADKRPQLSDLRESGAIEQDADIVIFLDCEMRDRTPEDEGTPDQAKLKIAKHRNGPNGLIRLIFWPEYQIFGSEANDH